MFWGSVVQGWGTSETQASQQAGDVGASGAHVTAHKASQRAFAHSHSCAQHLLVCLLSGSLEPTQGCNVSVCAHVCCRRQPLKQASFPSLKPTNHLCHPHLPPLLLQLAHCFTPPSDVPEAYQCAPVSLALFLTLSVCSVHSLPGCD